MVETRNATGKKNLNSGNKKKEKGQGRTGFNSPPNGLYYLNVCFAG
jgi:hypothetical protein